MTYLSNAQVKDIVHLCGLQIRLFLGNSNPNDYSGDAKAAILDFHKNPSEYSDERLLNKGVDVDAAYQHNVRFELRGVNPEGAAQVVAKGIWGEARDKAVDVLRKELVRHSHPLIVRTAGSSSFEFNRAGVDKSLPLKYLRACFADVLKIMGYIPGKQIDSQQTRIVISADGDGTIYDGPKLTHLPMLKESPAYAPLLSYLRAGGIFMLVSGNDLTRSYKRLIDGLPQDVYSRVLIAANGGADLAFVNREGKSEFILEYRHHALEAAGFHLKRPELDIVYCGDDDSPNGNDRAAFETVGKNHSVLVKSCYDTANYLIAWMHERKISLT